MIKFILILKYAISKEFSGLKLHFGQMQLWCSKEDFKHIYSTLRFTDHKRLRHLARPHIPNSLHTLRVSYALQESDSGPKVIGARASSVLFQFFVMNSLVVRTGISLQK